MDASGISSVKSQKKYCSIRTALASAFLEWLLICLLFIEAIFSYLITKFACYYELQTPCLLCSRLDHILGNKRLKYYRDLICGKHKLEISSLVLCHAHNKLVDVHGMCESCLFSFATINKSNAETYRLLVGKLGEGYRFGLNEDHTSSTQHCSCCNEPWILRGYVQNLMQTNIAGSETAEFDAPAVYDQNNLNKIELSLPARATLQRSKSEFDHLPHIGYTELKVNSDTESEVLFSDDDNNTNARGHAINTKQDIAVGCVQTEPRIISLHDDLVSEKLIDSVTALQTPILASQIQSDLVEFHGVTSKSPSVSLGHGLEEVQWQQADGKSNSSAFPELISLDEIPPSLIAKETPVEASKESMNSSFDNVPPLLDAKETFEEASKESILISVQDVLPSSVSRKTPLEASELSELISVDDVLPSSIAKETPVEASKESKNSSFDDVPPLFDPIETFKEVSKESILISLQEVLPSSVAGETPTEASEFSKLISVDDVLPSSIAKETPVEASKENKISFFDDVPPLFDAIETFKEASKESILISVQEVLPSSVAGETPIEASELSKLIPVDDVDVLPSSDSKEIPALASAESKLVSLVDVLPSPSEVETPIQGLQESCNARTEEVWQTAITDCEEISKTGTNSAAMNETALETNPVSGDNGLQAPNSLDLGDAYKLAVGNKGRQLSGALAEQWIAKDSSRLSDDLKTLFSQLSAAREHTMNDSSPRVPVSPKLSINGDELKNLDASSSIGIQMLQKRISLDRNESGLSLDGSIVSEIEGESAVDRLKRQIEHDKKLLSALYKELDEERNSSAISANQAMAMITRLQEEKATLQMEALQYLRMMEEQAEYDMEALQKTNDLLSEREKEIQDLEAELEFYRINPGESFWENTMQELSDTKTKDIKEEHPEATSVSTSTLRNSDSYKPDNCHEVGGRTIFRGDKNARNVKDSLLDFDDERAYILQCLKKLEKRLCLFSNNQLDLVNGEYSGKVEHRESELKELNSKLGFQVSSGAEENDDLSTQNDRGNGPAQGHALSLEKSELYGNEYNEMFYSGQSSPLPPGGIPLDSLANEVSDLNERLKALEADRNFLEHSINSIRNGEEGLQFIQEIASHLKELRRIGIRGRQQTVA
ncbi:myosin-binding protein 1 [Ricinus communis]|uniref:myosin-binding protein 1 n=1 Tax=Ricinus communis TaxID=3988 RepID=UPI00077243F1|nr:myosin-binding protein 1 [Ricinus communis]XP_048225580.1 myosin-binding protein 1 [Ricinus communis]XP_048225581.1 myosin-binding protein 1 [Ricinus communis]|eukprot:XP_015576557.1 myosin-binding protein 1 [Ricinus communis]